MNLEPTAEDRLFEREIELEERELARLVELLADEQRVLARHEDELLLGIAAEKAKHLASLERLSARRNQFLKRNGLRADHDGMLAWTAAHPERPSAARGWARIEELARAARDCNDINGSLIAAELQRFQRQLAFLNAAASNDATYSPGGYTCAAAPQRTLGEA
ncbi:MAG TPA: flagellar protein FlgN [Burkholderiales bacterium]|nr:flagellar protein FlgN [Burkholderiales bacterium]